MFPSKFLQVPSILTHFHAANEKFQNGGRDLAISRGLVWVNINMQTWSQNGINAINIDTFGVGYKYLLLWICFAIYTQIAKFMGPTWGPPGSCQPQMGPMLAPWTWISGYKEREPFLWLPLISPGPYALQLLYHMTSWHGNFSALLAFCVKNPLVTSRLSHKGQ